MTPKEMQRTMEFIVEQQARFSADIQKLFESDKELRQADERLRQSQATLTAAVMRIAELVEGLEKTTVERFAELAASQKLTNEQLRETDERLNALINVVEKHIMARRNGKKRRKS